MAATAKIESMADLPKAVSWFMTMVQRGLEGGPVVAILDREIRTPEQNKKGWALYTDISKNVEWYGCKLTPEDWKDLLTAVFEQQRLVPGINGGFVALGGRTSKYNKGKFSDFIESVYAFGSEKNVPWSEPALRAYEQYRKPVEKEA